MGALDDIKAAAGQHGDIIEQGIDAVGDAIDEKTDHKYVDQVDQAQDFLKEQLGKSE